MNEYPYPPPPYSPPIVHPSAWAYSAVPAESRSAAIWQLVLGSLIFLCGTCVSAVLFVPDNMLQMIVDQQQFKVQPIDHLSLIEGLRLVIACTAGLILIVGGLLMLLTIFVRKGGKISTTISMIIICIIGLITAMDLLGALIQVAGNPTVIVPLLISVGVLGLCITTVAKLAIAMKSAGSAQSIAQQQAYYWMMQQQAGAYGQAGYHPGGSAPAGWGHPGYYQGNYPPPPNPPPQNPTPLNPGGSSASPPNLPAQDIPSAPDQPPMSSDREK